MPRIAVALLLCACTPEKDTGTYVEPKDTAPTGDTALVIPTQVDQVRYEYSASSWTYEVLLRGWGEEVTLDIHGDILGVGTWDELHELVNIESDREERRWDLWRITLPIVGTPSRQTAGESTLFQGSPSAFDAMTWMVTAYEWGEPGVVAECVVYGADTAVYDEHDCFTLAFEPLE